MHPNVELRLAAMSDARPIATMSRDVVEVGLGWSWTPSRVLRSIHCPDTVVLVAVIQERIVGFANMYFGLEDAHLNLICVNPDQQGRGIGRKLITWLEESAVVAGIAVVYLQVRAVNLGAQTFYKKLGYHRVKSIPRYYRGRETALLMAHDLYETNHI